MSSQQEPDFDVIAVGAGFSGLALCHYLGEAGVSFRVFDRASDIGGTWTWNRYPGAMTDSESYYYCLTFSNELLQEWSWSSRYPDWKETLAYMHFVADKCDKCAKAITGKYVDLDGGARKLHQECYVCARCNIVKLS